MGIQKIYKNSFDHLHKLDLNYHKAHSKNSVYEINKAVRSLFDGGYNLLADITRYSLRFLIINSAVLYLGGPKYMINMIINFILYFKFTK
jgi:ABC-type transport system involved in Fe-S cluster assembly fused permease/ATPase subunit